MKHRVFGLIAVALMACASAATGGGGPAPDFTLDARSGKPLSLSQYQGQVVMLNFWASWCVPCRQEMPLLEGIHQKYSKLGFTLIGVNVEPDSAAADEVLKKIPVSFPIVYDRESKVSRLYRVSGMPSTVLIDRKGQLRLLHEGYKPGDESEYLNSIRALIEE